jgi:hypothetical protein
MDNIILKAKGFEIALDEKGVVKGLCYNGKSIKVEEKPFIALIKSRDEEAISPVSVSKNDNGITASFNDATIGVEVISHNEWLELKLCGDLPEGYFGLDFGCVEIKGFVEEADILRYSPTLSPTTYTSICIPMPTTARAGVRL